MVAQPSPEEQFLGIVNNHWQAHCVGLAAKLELADHLADGPLSIEQLADRSGTHAPSLFRMLRALEGTGIFAQTEAGIAREYGPREGVLKRNPAYERMGPLHCLPPQNQTDIRAEMSPCGLSS